jgi:uncharacterized protein (DUF58 family)
MTRRASPRLRAYLVLGAGGLILGAFIGRPEPVLLVAPLLIAAILALVVVRDPDVSIEMALPSDRVLEGEAIELDVRISSPGVVRWLELAIALPSGLESPRGRSVHGLRVDRGEERHMALGVTARRWGVFRIDQVVVRVRDRFGFFAYEQTIDPELSLRVFPRPAALRRAIRAAETQVYAGDEVARRRGDGIEFADVRPYSPAGQSCTSTCSTRNGAPTS